MISKVYISSAKLMLQERDIISIVKAAQIKNQSMGITGILLFNSGNFMQLIEGAEANVAELYEKIKNDNRHTDVTQLLEEEISHRNFDNWFMGYKDLATLNRVDQDILSPFLNEEPNFSIYKNNSYRALEFLEMFKKIQS